MFQSVVLCRSLADRWNRLVSFSLKGQTGCENYRKRFLSGRSQQFSIGEDSLFRDRCILSCDALPITVYHNFVASSPSFRFASFIIGWIFSELLLSKCEKQYLAVLSNVPQSFRILRDRKMLAFSSRSLSTILHDVVSGFSSLLCFPRRLTFSTSGRKPINSFRPRVQKLFSSARSSFSDSPEFRCS